MSFELDDINIHTHVYRHIHMQYTYMYIYMCVCVCIHMCIYINTLQESALGCKHMVALDRSIPDHSGHHKDSDE